MRHLQKALDSSSGTCRRILKHDLHLHPYRLRAAHEILPVDKPNDKNFVKNLLASLFFNNVGIEKVMLTNESWFHLSDYVNSQNMRIWNVNNPHFFVEAPLHPQFRSLCSCFTEREYWMCGPHFGGSRS